MVVVIPQEYVIIVVCREKARGQIILLASTVQVDMGNLNSLGLCIAKIT